MHKLPKPKAFIENAKESEVEYRIRRIERVIERLKVEGELIREWKVMREAGIKLKFYEEIKEFLLNIK